MVRITAKRAELHDETTDTYHYRERSTGNVERCLAVPANCDVEKAIAKFENGTLLLTFPKLVKGKTGKRLSIS